jgi:hypothetical protein
VMWPFAFRSLDERLVHRAHGFFPVFQVEQHRPAWALGNRTNSITR